MSKKYDINDYHNLIHYYLVKLDLLDFRCTSKFEARFLYEHLKDLYETVSSHLDF